MGLDRGLLFAAATGLFRFCYAAASEKAGAVFGALGACCGNSKAGVIELNL
jgi:hypothetical protein